VSFGARKGHKKGVLVARNGEDVNGKGRKDVHSGNLFEILIRGLGVVGLKLFSGKISWWVWSSERSNDRILECLKSESWRTYLSSLRAFP